MGLTVKSTFNLGLVRNNSSKKPAVCSSISPTDKRLRSKKEAGNLWQFETIGPPDANSYAQAVPKLRIRQVEDLKADDDVEQAV
jgi:hypothetical protein